MNKITIEEAFERLLMGRAAEETGVYRHGDYEMVWARGVEGFSGTIKHMTWGSPDVPRPDEWSIEDRVKYGDSRLKKMDDLFAAKNAYFDNPNEETSAALNAAIEAADPHKDAILDEMVAKYG